MRDREKAIAAAEAIQRQHPTVTVNVKWLIVAAIEKAVDEEAEACAAEAMRDDLCLYGNQSVHATADGWKRNPYPCHVNIAAAIKARKAVESGADGGNVVS